MSRSLLLLFGTSACFPLLLAQEPPPPPPPPSAATEMHWTPAQTLTPSGGSGNWDYSAQNWTSNGVTLTSFGSGDTAIFQGAGGTVTITESGGVAVSHLTFASNGYTITGNQLTVSGQLTLHGNTVTFAGPFAGPDGQTFQITTSGTAVFTGTSALSLHSLSINSASVFSYQRTGSASLHLAVINLGGTFDLQGNGALTGTPALFTISEPGVLKLNGHSAAFGQYYSGTAQDVKFHFGAGGGNILSFTSATTSATASLTVYDWVNGSTSLRFTTAPDQAWLNNITFDGYGLGAQAIDRGSYYELAPASLSAVPEPSSYAALAGAAALGLALSRRRRHHAASCPAPNDPP